MELKQSVWTKLKRIDFIGAFFMSVAILACITAFDLGSKKANTSVLITLVVIGVSAGALFALTEKFWAKEPIFPLELLGQHAVITSYSIILIQTGIQVAVSINPCLCSTMACCVLTSVDSLCSWCRCTSRSQQTQVWVKPVHISFLPFSVIRLVVLLLAHGSSGECPVSILVANTDKSQHWPLQVANYPSQHVGYALLFPPSSTLAWTHKHRRVPCHFLRWLRIWNGKLCSLCRLDRWRREAPNGHRNHWNVSELEHRHGGRCECSKRHLPICTKIKPPPSFGKNARRRRGMSFQML